MDSFVCVGGGAAKRRPRPPWLNQVLLFLLCDVGSVGVVKSNGSIRDPGSSGGAGSLNRIIYAIVARGYFTLNRGRNGLRRWLNRGIVIGFRKKIWRIV